MADNVPSKSSKSIDKTKPNNTIHRTTSETLRLGDSEAVPNNSGALIASNQRKKPCSFQITSVIVGRMTNDGGDDSADDLDESHADDISDLNSRITDNETPSYSEDTYSKEDIFFNVSNSSLCSAPVIPTSSQYGLAIVSPGGNPALNNSGDNNSSVTGTINALDVNVTVVNPASVGLDHTHATKLQEQENKDMQSNPGRNDRFKVVKIESTEPFKRGRWSCMDFLDSANQQFGHLPQSARSETAGGMTTGSTQFASDSATMADFRNEQSGPNGNITAGNNFQQQTQSLPPQQLTQNLVQSNQVLMTQSQNQYYAPQQVQGQSNISHIQSTQQNINSQYTQQSSVQHPIPQAQYPVPQGNPHQQQIGMQGMVLQSVPTSMSGGFPINQQPTVPVQQASIQQVSHNVVQPNPSQMPQMGIVQGQVLPQQNIVQQGQTQNSSSVVSQVPYNQPSSSFTPTSSSVIPSQYVAQSQTFSSQSSQPHMITQQTVGSLYSSQPVASNVSTQGQSYSGNQVQQNIQGQSYASQPAQIVNSNLPVQGQSYAGQLSQVITSNVSTQGQSFAGHTTQSTTGNVSSQGQSYTGQPSQIVGNLTSAQGQSYSHSPLSSNIVPGQSQSFSNQQTQTTYAQLLMPQGQNQAYIQANQPQQQQQSSVQHQTQNFHGQSQGQTYVSQLGSYHGVNSSQMYSQNVGGMANAPQSQNYVVSMPSSPASVPQQPIYPSSSLGASNELPHTYSQPQNYVPTSATGVQPHILSHIGNFPSQGQTYSTVGVQLQSSYPATQPNISGQANYRSGTAQTRTSCTYTGSQFKGHTSTSQSDGPSPSEGPPSENTGETLGLSEDNQNPVDDADR